MTTRKIKIGGSALLGLVVILGLVYLLFKPDDCSSELYLSGRTLSLEAAAGELGVKAKASPSVQQAIGERLQALAQTSSEWCRLHRKGVIDDKRYAEEVAKTTAWYQRLSDALAKGQLAGPDLTPADLDAIVFRSITQSGGGVEPFMIFFDWDKADISPQAAAVLDSVLSRCRDYESSGRKFVISVEGHSDDAEIDEFRQMTPVDRYIGKKTISAARMGSAICYLRDADEGTCDAPIIFTDYASDRPLVETADGVREPQNRRAEIILRPAI